VSGADAQLDALAHCPPLVPSRSSTVVRGRDRVPLDFLRSLSDRSDRPRPPTERTATVKKHDTFEFSRAGSRQSIYDWDAILSGDVVELESGKDFKCQPSSLAARLHLKAKERGGTLKTQTLKPSGNLIVQFTRESEKVAAEDPRRTAAGRSRLPSPAEARATAGLLRS
jgi:hypothetical protein